MDRIILEVFPTIVKNGDMNDLIYFYDVNKTFRRLLQTPYILKQLSMSFDCFNDVVNYYQIGLPFYEYLVTKYSIKESFAPDLVSSLMNYHNNNMYFYIKQNRICVYRYPNNTHPISHIKLEHKHIFLTMNSQFKISASMILNNDLSSLVSKYLQWYYPVKHKKEYEKQKRWVIENHGYG